MKKISDVIKQKKGLLFLFVLVTGVFLILYHKTIWGGYVHIYTDVGSDSLFLEYPNLYIRNMIQSKQISAGYLLRQGLGTQVSITDVLITDPLRWSYLFVDADHLMCAKLVSMYFQYLVTAFFSYMFWKKILKNEMSCMIATVIWTFSGYMVLWEQHSFSIAVAYFTVVLYFLQCYLEGKKQGVFAVLPLSWLALYSYYFFYMVGLFCALYVTGYCIIKKRPVKQWIGKILGLAGAGVMSGTMAAIGLIPALRKFLVSARTDVSEQAVHGLLQSPQYLVSALGRFLSNDIFGTGSNFSGYYNYYEAAMLACSLLVIPAIIVLLRTKYKKVVSAFILLCSLMLVTPITSYIFNFDSRKPRWTFMVIFLMVFAVGLAIDCLLEHAVKVSLKDILIIFGVYVAIFLILLCADRSGVVDVKREPAMFVLIFVCVYCILLLCFSGLSRKMVSIIMLLTVTTEIVLANYPAVNQRLMLSQDELKHGYYNDGTSDILHYVDGENGIYRVNKTYDSVFWNDAAVQGYNGLTVYDATNSKWLIEFYQTMGFELINGKIHYVRIPADRSVLNTLLGVKYIVARDGEVTPSNYEAIYSLNGKTLYLNKQALGFGYIYNSQMNRSEFEQLSNDEKDIALTQFYFLTDEEKHDNRDTQDIQISLENSNVDDNLEQLRRNSAYNTSQDGTTIQFDIYNSYDSNAMLCVPVIYDTNWRAYVNGQPTECVNINGGLLAVDMSNYASGEYKITLEYQVNEYVIGGIISVIACIAYVFGLIIYFKKKDKENCTKTFY